MLNQTREKERGGRGGGRSFSRREDFGRREKSTAERENPDNNKRLRHATLIEGILSLFECILKLTSFLIIHCIKLSIDIS